MVTGARSWVGSWIIEGSNSLQNSQTFTDFRNRYMNRYVSVERDDKIIRVSAGKYWLAAPRRRSYDGVVFDPEHGSEVWGNRLNLWRGFALVPKKGSWRLLLRHTYRVLGNGDRK